MQFSYISILETHFVTCNISLWLEMQSPTAEVQAVMEVHSEVDEGTSSLSSDTFSWKQVCPRK